MHTAIANAAGSLTGVVTTVVHGAIGGAIAVAQGGEFLHGAVGSALGAIGGMLGGHLFPDGLGDGFAANPGGFIGRTTIAAVAGGAGSAIVGGKFANGAVTAAFSHMFNAEKILSFGNKPHGSLINTPNSGKLFDSLQSAWDNSLGEKRDLGAEYYPAQNASGEIIPELGVAFYETSKGQFSTMVSL